MICPKCGNKTPTESRFCGTCGENLDSARKNAAQASVSTESANSTYSGSNNNYVAANNAQSDTVSVGEWIVTTLILCIPLVGIIMMFVWAFGGGAKPSKRNYFRAELIFLLICVVLSIIIVVVIGIGAASLFRLQRF